MHKQKKCQRDSRLLSKNLVSLNWPLGPISEQIDMFFPVFGQEFEPELNDGSDNVCGFFLRDGMYFHHQKSDLPKGFGSVFKNAIFRPFDVHFTKINGVRSEFITNNAVHRPQ